MSMFPQRIYFEDVFLIILVVFLLYGFTSGKLFVRSQAEEIIDLAIKDAYDQLR